MASLSAELRDQLRRTCVELREAIALCPDTLWRQAAVTRHAPCRQAIHCLETIEFYCRDALAEFTWGARFGLDWEGAEAAMLPDREPVLAWLDEAFVAADAWLAAKSDDELMAVGNPFPWTGASCVGRMIYLLRHNQHHVALINAELRRAGLDPADWQ